MAEQEIIKHTKRIFGIWKTENTFLYKFSEFIGEILIIVFAVTISIYFHDRSELRHQRNDTKEFLLGLKQDLKTDTVEMNEDKNAYEHAQIIFRYIGNRKLNETLNADTVKKYGEWLFSTTGLAPNNGRFEGFKSAGKIGTIENRELQNNIMDLYQEDLPSLLTSTNTFNANKNRFFEFLSVNVKRITDSTTNLDKVLSTDEAFIRINSLNYIGEIIKRYDSCISKSRTIIEEINKEYGE